MTEDKFDRAIFDRMNELHPRIFGEAPPKLHEAEEYFSLHEKWNELGFGTDYSQHPRNPFREQL